MFSLVHVRPLALVTCYPGAGCTWRWRPTAQVTEHCLLQPYNFIGSQPLQSWILMNIFKKVLLWYCIKPNLGYWLLVRLWNELIWWLTFPCSHACILHSHDRTLFASDIDFPYLVSHYDKPSLYRCHIKMVLCCLLLIPIDLMSLMYHGAPDDNRWHPGHQYSDAKITLGRGPGEECTNWLRILVIVITQVRVCPDFT